MNVKKSGKVYIRCMGGDEDVSLRQTFFFFKLKAAENQLVKAHFYEGPLVNIA